MRLTIRTDGGSRGNPGPAAAGVVIFDKKKKVLFQGGFFLGSATNNVAEYSALLRGLELAQQLGGTDLQVFCDSELIVKQVNGEYRVKNAQLKNYHNQIVSLLSQFPQATVRHVYRSDNQDADAMVNQSLDAAADVGGMLDQDSTNPPPEDIDSLESAANSDVVDLRSEVRFDRVQPVPIILGKNGKLKTELLCLQPDQNAFVSSGTRPITITVMRGAGTVKTNETKRTVQAGSWLGLERAGKIEFSASATQPLVVILTSVGK